MHTRVVLREIAVRWCRHLEFERDIFYTHYTNEGQRPMSVYFAHLISKQSISVKPREIASLSMVHPGEAYCRPTCDSNEKVSRYGKSLESLQLSDDIQKVFDKCWAWSVAVGIEGKSRTVQLVVKKRSSLGQMQYGRPMLPFRERCYRYILDTHLPAKKKASCTPLHLWLLPAAYTFFQDHQLFITTSIEPFSPKWDDSCKLYYHNLGAVIRMEYSLDWVHIKSPLIPHGWFSLSPSYQGKELKQVRPNLPYSQWHGCGPSHGFSMEAKHPLLYILSLQQPSEG